VIDTEPLYAALWARASAAPGFVTSSRRLKHWDDVPAKQQPALFMSQTEQTPTLRNGRPVSWRLHADLYIYVASSGGLPIGPAMNAALLALLARFVPDSPSVHTCSLGGLVHDACVSGEIKVYEGVLDDQAVAIVPIAMTAPD
jgi:hypothetical protein